MNYFISRLLKKSFCLMSQKIGINNALLEKILFFCKTKGVREVHGKVYNHPIPKQAECFSLCSNLVSDKIGLEIGGPSKVFARKGILPIYPIVKRLDNCNFSNETIWKRTIIQGINYQYDENRPLGKQYISEATDLYSIPNETYEFIISSHVIEHIANPLLALSEWIRVLKEGGGLVLLVPHRDGTFDHRRSVTTIEHLIEDFGKKTNENDLTHLPEILQFHDIERDPGAGAFEAFKNRAVRNFVNRSLHHHVFNTALVVEMVSYMNLQILDVEALQPCHIIIVVQKLRAKQRLNNQSFIGDEAEYRHQSPFASDKRGGVSLTCYQSSTGLPVGE